MSDKAEVKLPRSASRAVYLNKAGERYAVYHANKSHTVSWQHDYTQEAMKECPACPSSTMT